jgi:RNase_H superfamily
MKKNNAPKILFLDIETAPMLAYVWQLFDVNVGLNQIHKDWHLLSFAAKWKDRKEVFYADQRNQKDIADDKSLMEKIWKLLDSCDVLVGQNIKAFDRKKINARFLAHGMTPPSSYKMIDTLSIAKKNFALTSSKLEYMSSNFNTKFKKQSHKKFPGFVLWTECLKGNLEAWDEMKKYNIYDVLATEELYNKLAPWEPAINFSIYSNALDHTCSCGNKTFKNKGYAYTSSGKFKRYLCTNPLCGKESRGKENLLTIEKRQSLRR